MATKQRKIEINYRLLQTSCNIEVVGSVPDMQVYQDFLVTGGEVYSLIEEHGSVAM